MAGTIDEASIKVSDDRHAPQCVSDSGAQLYSVIQDLRLAIAATRRLVAPLLPPSLLSAYSQIVKV